MNKSVSQTRWEQLLQSNDSRLIRKSVYWKGGMNETDEQQPSESQLKIHFDALLNNRSQNDCEIDISESPCVPVLDDPFTACSKEFGQKKKSYSGLCPGVIGMLLPEWISFFSVILNVLFLYA